MIFTKITLGALGLRLVEVAAQVGLAEEQTSGLPGQWMDVAPGAAPDAALHRARARDRDVANDLAFDLALVRDRTLARDLTNHVTLARDLASDLDIARALEQDRQYDRAHDLVRAHAGALLVQVERSAGRARQFVSEGKSWSRTVRGQGFGLVEPARAAVRMTAWVLRLLPAVDRPRYREELAAELHELAQAGVSWRGQVG